MARKVVPMIHVPDVRATVTWYQNIGFDLSGQNEEAGCFNWALLTFGNTEVMLSAGGKTSNAERREVDLYVFVENIDALHASLRSRVDLVEDLHDTEYGMREFIIRDPNRFWVTFGQSFNRSKA